MNQSKLINTLFWSIAFLSIPLWILSNPETSFRHNTEFLFIYGSQMFAVLGFSMLALSFVLSARFKFLEKYFGGLDRMYATHHLMSKLSILFITTHAILLAVRWIPENTEKALRYLLPEHERIEVDLGIYALYGFLIIIIFTLFIKLPYDKWKVLHKFTGVFFILAILHVYILEVNIFRDKALMIYFSILCFTGVGSYLYKTVFFKLFVKDLNFIVEKVYKLNESVMEVVFKSNSVIPVFESGQYYFFSFRDKSISKEYHPYTIFRSENKNEIMVMIKALGDYTKELYNKIKPGMRVKLEGPYGYFNFRHGGNNQIWIGGGVGIAPFISWVRDLKENGFSENLNVDLFYCTEHENDAIHLTEFKKFESENPGFKLKLVCAAETGLLKADEIELNNSFDVFICGPKQMRIDLLKGLVNKGVSKDKIHFEDFDFV